MNLIDKYTTDSEETSKKLISVESYAFIEALQELTAAIIMTGAGKV